MPVSWKGTLVQYAGRLHRLYPGKTEVRIYDYVDRSVPMLARMFAKRLRGYRAVGYARGSGSITREEEDNEALESLQPIEPRFAESRAAALGLPLPYPSHSAPPGVSSGRSDSLSSSTRCV